MISQITTWDSMSWPAVDSDQNAKPCNMVQCQTYLIGLGVTISSPTRNESKLLYLAKNESMLLIIAFIWLSAARRCLGRFLIVDTDLSSGWENRKMALVLFKEIGHSLNPANSLVLSASPSAYSVNPNSNISSPPSLSGSSISLVSVVQARNNARIVFSGSLDLFSNKFFKSPVQKAGSSNKYEKSGKIYFKQGGVEMSMPQGSFENLPIPKKRLSRKEDIIMVDDQAKLAKAFSQSIRVLLYGGVGPLPSDVSIAGVAKAFGVRLDEEMIEAAMEPISTKLSSK
ncbi:hypothetical protein L2E82_34225 [Cichorium intybus]|uniref:Uncharacterized protein n=1 Tax=Cichorium intybus TaxID=13427 RepID=A0ACB9BLS8_CICIN|nr:hypothetical protein L2E82_34225 [Cichorium intybus]